MKALKRCDVAIGAVRGNNRSPVIVTQTMVDNMKNGAVVIDVSIDMGGCFETSEVTTHDHPTFIIMVLRTIVCQIFLLDIQELPQYQ